MERAQVEAVSPERWRDTRVAGVMRSIDELPALSPEQPADEALDRTLRTERGQLPVARGGGLVGVPSTSDIARWQAWARRSGA